MLVCGLFFLFYTCIQCGIKTISMYLSLHPLFISYCYLNFYCLKNDLMGIGFLPALPAGRQEIFLKYGCKFR